MEAAELTRVTPDEVARQAAGANRAKANQLLEKIHDQMETIRLTKSYQGIVNYDYWGLRADVEQTDGMLEARKLVFEADAAYAEGDLPRRPRRLRARRGRLGRRAGEVPPTHDATSPRSTTSTT